MGPRKQDNYIKDLLHWAHFMGVEVSPKVRDYILSDARPALRTALAVRETSQSNEFHYAAYRARWSEARATL